VSDTGRNEPGNFGARIRAVFSTKKPVEVRLGIVDRARLAAHRVDRADHQLTRKGTKSICGCRRATGEAINYAEWDRIIAAHSPVSADPRVRRRHRCAAVVGSSLRDQRLSVWEA